MFPGWLQGFFRMIISNERSKGTRWSPTIRWSQLFDDPQLSDDPQPFDDPQLFDDQLEVWTLINQKSTVIPPSLMVLFIIWSMMMRKWWKFDDENQDTAASHQTIGALHIISLNIENVTESMRKVKLDEILDHNAKECCYKVWQESWLPRQKRRTELQLSAATRRGK